MKKKSRFLSDSLGINIILNQVNLSLTLHMKHTWPHEADLERDTAVHNISKYK